LLKTYANTDFFPTKKNPHKLKDVLIKYLNRFKMQLPNCFQPKPITKFCCIAKQQPQKATIWLLKCRKFLKEKPERKVTQKFPHKW